MLLDATRRCFFLASIACLLLSPAWLSAQSVNDQGRVTFDVQSLQMVPKVEAAKIDGQGLQAIFYEGLPYEGKPTQVFAYYGIPTQGAGADEQQKVPGIVLVHGGGGTAFANWVKLWNARGYAAIAMDLCGCVPVGTYGKWQRHERGGPPGWDASFEQIKQPLGDQWQTHAVTAVARANSLLRSLPQVDPDRIALTGISWGGYMTCLVAGVDARFKCAAPVYGCGYLGDNSAWLPAFERLGKQNASQWLNQWDPSVYLPAARMPFLWVNGTNDFAYPMDSWQRSIELHQDNTLCLRIRMPHGHGAAGENPEEIRVFVDSVLKGAKPLPQLDMPRVAGARVTVSFKSQVALKKAELCFTKDTGKWQERQWDALPADLDIDQSIITATIPESARVWYINLFDERDCVVSSHYVGKE